MNNPPDFWRRDYPFQIACVQPPPPLRKNRRRGVCGEDATVHRLVSDGWSISSSGVKTANNKISVSIVFNDSEGLYGMTVCRCFVRRPHYSARQMSFEWRGPSEFDTEMSWPRLRSYGWRQNGKRNQWKTAKEISSQSEKTDWPVYFANLNLVVIVGLFHDNKPISHLKNWCFSRKTEKRES